MEVTKVPGGIIRYSRPSHNFPGFQLALSKIAMKIRNQVGGNWFMSGSSSRLLYTATNPPALSMALKRYRPHDGKHLSCGNEAATQEPNVDRPAGIAQALRLPLPSGLIKP